MSDEVDREAFEDRLRRELHLAVDLVEVPETVTERVRVGVLAGPRATATAATTAAADTTRLVAVRDDALDRDDGAAVIPLEPAASSRATRRALRRRLRAIAAAAAIMLLVTTGALLRSGAIEDATVTGGAGAHDQPRDRQDDQSFAVQPSADHEPTSSAPIAPSNASPGSSPTTSPPANQPGRQAPQAPDSSTTPTMTGPSAIVSSHHLDPVLQTTRRLESGDDYTFQSSAGSGAYNISDADWDHFRGYASASAAPVDVQDEKAAVLVGTRVKTSSNMALVPVAWYLGYVPPSDSPVWDQVPTPSKGKDLTVRQYQSKWLDLYTNVAGCRPAAAAVTARPPLPAGGPTPTPSTVPLPSSTTTVPTVKPCLASSGG